MVYTQKNWDSKLQTRGNLFAYNTSYLHALPNTEEFFYSVDIY